jgi:NPCBM-associated, NEW3 domain of alpha-galactosidase
VPLLIALLAALALVVASPPSAWANFVATAEDPEGDAVDASPGRDIVAVGLSYDRRKGELFGAIQLRGAPEGAPAFVTLFAGTRTATGCDGYPAAGFGSYTDEFGASWLRLDAADAVVARGEADKTGFAANVQEFEISDRRLRGLRLGCVIATLTAPENPATVYDAVGPLPLEGRPALSVRVGGVSRPFVAGRSRRIELTLSNTGDAPTRRVRLKLGRPRGVTLKPRIRSLKPIAPGRRRTVRVTVTASARARTSTDLKVVADAGELVARGEVTLRVRKPAKPGGGGGGGNDPAQLCTRFMADLTGETGGSLILVPC